MKKIDVSKCLTLDEWEDTIDFVYSCTDNEFNDDDFVISKRNIRVFTDIKHQLNLNAGNIFDILEAFDVRDIDSLEYLLPEERKSSNGYVFTFPTNGHIKKLYTDAAFRLMRSNPHGSEFHVCDLSVFNYLIEVEINKGRSTKKGQVTSFSFNPELIAKKSEMDSLELPKLQVLWNYDIKNEWDKVGREPRYVLKLDH